MRTLTIFYDPSCGLCCQFREWLERQALWVATEFIGFQTPEAADRFPQILEVGAAKNCVVLADDGRWWQGADAWIVCLWATREFRLWSHRLAGPVFKPVLGSVVHLISGNRLTLSKLMRLKSDAALVEELKRHQPECEGGGCALPHLAKVKNTYKAWK
ncbi:thiol-disulfide oxidoreductase DCC family protein [Haloferula sp.]|uniref:thiol-disulfide oxidoreductase DCC family protein n=1 Tax=Haloferula sp. TaxID=2497595 RepID=UPI003C762318